MIRLVTTLSLLLMLAAPAAARTVTFNEDVAPLVWKNCAGCHRPGEVAPFALLSYRDVSKRADQIVDVAERRIMPPWKPVPGHGEFSNGRRLSSAELNLLKQWIADGLAEGDAAKQPTPPTFAEGWQLGTPDQVITMTEPAEVPADGRDMYLNVILPVQVPTGKYIKAIEFRPSNRRVVHHAVLFYDTSGKARTRDKEDPRQGFQAVTPPGQFLPGALAIWTPGRLAMPLPEGLSMPWPENADLVLNLHLHPSGKPEQEQSSIGVHFTSEPPQRTMVDVMLIDTKIDIPPGERAFQTHDSCILPIDADLLTIFPHMHMIGKQMTVTATLPDGTVKPLLKIDDWDFNWQDLYQYAQPVRLPRGTRIDMASVHDNSAENPRNPSSPPQRVRWGEQTLNEMSIAFLNLMPANEQDMVNIVLHKGHRVRSAIMPEATKQAVAKAPPATEAELAASQRQQATDLLQYTDKDKNGKLSAKELTAIVGGKVPIEELERRIKQVDTDDDQELNLDEVIAAIKLLQKAKKKD